MQAKNKGQNLNATRAKIEQKIKMNLRVVASVISNCIVGEELYSECEKKANITAKKIFFVLLSFFLGLSRLDIGMNPFALGAFCASGRWQVPYCFFGACASLIFFGRYGFMQFICLFLSFLVRRTLTKGAFDEKVSVKLVFSFFASLIMGFCNVLYEKAGVKTFVSYAVYVVLCVFCTYLFEKSLYAKRSSVSEGLYTLSVYSLCVCIVPGLSRFSFLHFDTALLYCALVTMYISKLRGPVYGCVCGFVTGFACQNPLLSAPLGIGGLVIGYSYGKNKTVGCISFCASCFFVSLYLFGKSAVINYLLPYLVSFSLFLVFAERLPDIFSFGIKRCKVKEIRQNDESFDKVSESLSGLSAIIYKFAEHLKMPSSAETGEVVDKAFDVVCSSCSMSNFCYAKKECDYKRVRGELSALLHKRPLEMSSLSHLLLDKCIKSKELCDRINADYLELNFLTMKSNRTQSVASMYNSMSHLLKDTSENAKKENFRDGHLEEKIATALGNMGVEFSFVTANGKRNKNICVHGIRADKIPCSGEDLSKYLSDFCKIKLSSPSFDISDSADLVMKFWRDEILSLEYAQCSLSKNENDVCGDTVSFFESDNGYFYAIVADGMGSGKTAAATSRLSVMFLEKMLTAGTAKNICLEMLNNLLLSKNDETFSTVDLLEIDKLTLSANFIKAGAASSFVLRKNHLYKISSETPPVGIIPAFSAESTRFSLERGDVIFIVSDGVVQSDDDGIWLSELIRLDSKNEPALLASKLIDRARCINDRRDDATACVIRVI